jgi:AcrR family transcriptional regulator
MNDIADAVGIVKASLYSHYAGKDELFLAVAEDFLGDFKVLSDRLYEAPGITDLTGRLHYVFAEYILHYLRNPLLINFASQSIKFVPDELLESFIPQYRSLEQEYRRRLVALFAEGMQQGVVSPGEPEKKAWSFRVMRDGALTWILIEQLGEDYVEHFWNDFWLGIARRLK